MQPNTPLLVLALVAGLASSARAQLQEAENLYFNGGHVLFSTEASGGAFLRLDAGGDLTIEAFTTATENEIVLTLMQPAAGAILLVQVQGFEAFEHECGAAIPGQPITETIPLPLVDPGSVVTTITLFDPHVYAVDIDTVCPPGPGDEGDSCPGCRFAPVPAAQFAQGHGAHLFLPPLPGLGDEVTTTILTTGAGTVSIPTVDIQGLTLTISHGACELHATGGSSSSSCTPGDLECVQKDPCSVTSRLTFRANNYARPPFWNSTETVAFPDGTTEDVPRSSIFITREETRTIACGTSVELKWTFEKGASLTQSLTCNACE